MKQIIQEAKELYDKLIKDKPDIRQHAQILAKVHKKKFKMQNPISEEQKAKNKDNLLYMHQQKDPDENMKLSADGGISNFNQHSTTSLAEGQLGQLLQQESFMAEITKGKDIYQFLKENNIDLIEEEDDEEDDEQSQNTIANIQANRYKSQNLSQKSQNLGADLKDVDKIHRVMKRKSTVFDQDKIKNKAIDHINQKNFLEAENDLQIFLNQSIKKRMQEQIEEGVKNYFQMIKDMMQKDSNISTITIFYYLQNFLIYMDQNQLPEPKSIKNFKFERFYGKHGKNNTTLLEIFIRRHNEEIVQFFNSFTNGKNFINSNDIIIAFQQILDIQDLTLYEFKEDDTHFFNKYNSYKLIKEQADVFLSQQKFQNKFFPSGYNKEEGVKLGLYEILSFIADFIDSMEDCYLEWEDFEQSEPEIQAQKPESPKQQPKVNQIEVKTEEEYFENKNEKQQIQQTEQKKPENLLEMMQQDIQKYSEIFKGLKPGNQQIEVLKVIQQIKDSVKIIQNGRKKSLLKQQTAPFLDQINKFVYPTKFQKNNSIYNNKNQQINEEETNQNNNNIQNTDQLQENLKEIFNFYANQQDKLSLNNLSMHNIQEHTNTMNWKQFIQFVRQFQIEDFNRHVNIVKIQPIFKQRSNMTFKPINFKQFEQICKDISYLMFTIQNNEIPTENDKSYKLPQYKNLKQSQSQFLASNRQSSPAFINDSILDNINKNKQNLNEIVNTQQNDYSNNNNINNMENSYQLPNYTQSLDQNAFKSVLNNKSSLPNIFNNQKQQKSSLKSQPKYSFKTLNSIELETNNKPYFQPEINENDNENNNNNDHIKIQSKNQSFVSFQTPNNTQDEEKIKAYKTFQHYIHLDDREYYLKIMKSKGYFFFISQEKHGFREDFHYSKQFDQKHPELEEQKKNQTHIKRNKEFLSQIKSPKKQQNQLSFLSNKNKLLNLSKIKQRQPQNNYNNNININLTTSNSTFNNKNQQIDQFSSINNKSQSNTPFMTSSNLNFNNTNNTNQQKSVSNFTQQFDGITPKNNQNQNNNSNQKNTQPVIDTNLEKKDNKDKTNKNIENEKDDNPKNENSQKKIVKIKVNNTGSKKSIQTHRIVKNNKVSEN